MKALALIAFAIAASLLPLACEEDVAPIVIAEDDPLFAMTSASFAPAEAPPAGRARIVDPTPALSAEEIDFYRELFVRDLSERTGGPPFARSPEAFSKTMTGTFACNQKTCRAGREVCAVSPQTDYQVHCEAISEWLEHRTPRPQRGFPPMAGITACGGSHNCPKGSVCCLHEIGVAEVQAIACHQSVDECRDKVELCDTDVPNSCRTPGTSCREKVVDGVSHGARCLPR